MPSLIDVRPATETVAGVTVRAASAVVIADLLAAHPEIRKVMTGMNVSADSLIALGPAAVAEVIAACTMPISDYSDPEKRKPHQEAASTLGVGVQVDFLDAIIRLSMPSGIGPFMERLEAITAGLNGRGVAQATKSPKPSKS